LFDEARILQRNKPVRRGAAAFVLFRGAEMWNNPAIEKQYWGES